MNGNNELTITPKNISSDDREKKVGMRIFLFAKLLVFGVLLLVYGFYRFRYSDQFNLAGMGLNIGIGTLNTIILLTCSLTAAIAVAAFQKKNKFLSILMIIVTLTFALMFIVNKYFEWSANYLQGIFPGTDEFSILPSGQVLFLGLYYIMTGLHSLLVLAGFIVLLIILRMIIKGKINFDNHIKLENTGLLWHLITIIWIFLFPLFYLIQ